MEKINFVNNREPAISAENLNKLQSNIQEAIEALYPVGSIYMNLNNSTNPATLFGFGTWERLKDTFIYALGDSGSAGDTGGSATHSHTQASTTGSTALTVDQMPSHNHTVASSGAHTHTGVNINGVNVSVNNGIAGEGYGFGITGDKSYSQLAVANTGSSHTHTINNTGGGSGHTHTLGKTNSASSLPPYIKAYIWKRTA